MGKRNRIKYVPEPGIQQLDSAPQETGPTEEPIDHGFIVRKLSLSEWQIIDVKIQGNEIIFKKEREPDVAQIVHKKLMQEIARAE